MRRIIFVGMNNKPGVAPLCSTTKSGRLIDRVICKFLDFECVKSNLWDIDYFPKSSGFNFEWCKRVEYTSDDIIVALGDCVQKAFKKSPYKFVSIGHPSVIWSNKGKEEYVERAEKRIIEVIKSTLTA